MDSQYGIAVTNKFCLFDEDDDVDPYEILKQEEQKRKDAIAKEKTDKSKQPKKTKKSAPQPDKGKLSEQNIQKKEGNFRKCKIVKRQYSLFLSCHMFTLYGHDLIVISSSLQI